MNVGRFQLGKIRQEHLALPERATIRRGITSAPSLQSASSFLFASTPTLFCPRVADSGRQAGETGQAVKGASSGPLRQKGETIGPVYRGKPRPHPASGEQAVGHTRCRCRSRQPSGLFHQDASRPYIPTQTPFSSPSGANVSSSSRSCRSSSPSS